MTDLKGKLAQKVEKVKEKETEAIQTINEAEIETVSVDDSKITKLVPVQLNQADYIVPEFAISINEARQRTRMLQKFVKDMMIPDIDYGLIPKCSKPSLLKPGAEKLCEIFGFSKQVEILNRIEDWNKGMFHYEVKVILVSKRTGMVEAEGLGCCNSMERKFKTQDSFSIVNTLLKMAKKRALVDAVLSATRSSGTFSQDLEEMDFTMEDNTQSITKTNNSKLIKPESKGESHKKPITKQQQSEIFLVIKQGKIPVNHAKGIMVEKYNIEESSKLTSEQAEEFIDILKCCQVV
jgi:hypothetical protein